jgi:hypothetical protein
MAYAHAGLASRFERTRVRRSLQPYSADELHKRAVFWRCAIPGGLMFWACVAYGIHSLA